ncbi:MULTISPECIES: nucleic acid/nucleotide deaminase domain-containing protein [Priestia]|nr:MULTISPECIES: nucleic acid/nucleotide deaminase domain-containing protein [Priestia]MCZ8495424.1 nucleic acid/nucleotide deaminase domain-containing protein [Priestia megaterium]MDG0058093.1 nucleic acid/nucleotide deaminase domain-containing protein [Priestia sp. P5]UYV51731.1 nucleic acid/nucleotide deaminase domain-containing protein [Priestia megaterium]
MKKEYKKEESQVKVDFRSGRAYGDHEYIGSSKKACFLLCYQF